MMWWCDDVMMWWLVIGDVVMWWCDDVIMMWWCKDWWCDDVVLWWCKDWWFENLRTETWESRLATTFQMGIYLQPIEYAPIPYYREYNLISSSFVLFSFVSGLYPVLKTKIINQSVKSNKWVYKLFLNRYSLYTDYILIIYWLFTDC